MIVTDSQSRGSNYASSKTLFGSRERTRAGPGSRVLARAAGGGRIGPTRGASVMRALRASRAFGRIRLCIRRWATPDNRRFRPSFSARKVQPSESRSAGIKRPRICTHSCLGGKNRMEKSRAGPPTKRRAAPFPFAKPSDGMLNWRHGRTRGLPDNYSGPSRDVSSQALNGFLTGFGRQRARGARVEPQLAKSGGYDPTFT